MIKSISAFISQSFSRLAVVSSLAGVASGLVAVPCSAAELQVLVLRDGAPVWVSREAPVVGQHVVRAVTPSDASLAGKIAAALAAQLAPVPLDQKAQGVKNFVPDGASVVSVEVADGACTAAIALPQEYLRAGIADEDLELYAEVMAGIARQFPEVRSLVVVTRDSSESPWRPLTSFAKPAPPPTKKPETKPETSPSQEKAEAKAGQNAALGQPQPSGALTGASI
ncbi:MAG: hypothetical protein N2Z21_05565, partial [Candidatus Sumerlaeaceae bacterium]|nr:hypothetical protein [Candidatus Sumerlaeaceae bacterium]